jgi:uncharacterized membrane protein YgcG
MKITKAQLKQIIKEELEVTLTNEEAGEMFGEEVQAQLEEQDLNEGVMDHINTTIQNLQQNMTLENTQLLVDAFIQMGATFGVPLLAAALVKLGFEALQAATTADKAKTMIGQKDSGRLVDFLYHELTGYKDFRGAPKQSLKDAEKEFPMAPSRPPMPK